MSENYVLAHTPTVVGSLTTKRMALHPKDPQPDSKTEIFISVFLYENYVLAHTPTVVGSFSTKRVALHPKDPQPDSKTEIFISVFYVRR
ncbi:hypothetical protein ACFOEK_01485 [Litoribrevibacter euphylliae]|uniref:Uncharacterized protein n=1 Tax=Litoribrevibacter euphylliae TaxID=1834034 RepID=A0ABV7HAJ3_9GAMM